MFAVMVDNRLKDYRAKINYAVHYLFTQLGYSYRLLAGDEVPQIDEIPFIYASDMKIVDDYLFSGPRGFAICVLHDVMHYNYDKLDKNDYKNSIRNFNVGYNIPYLSSREFPDPISRTCDGGQSRFYVGVFHFDLIGNIFFHLSGSEREIIKHKDQHKRFCYQNSQFEKYLNYPYLTGMIRLIELFLEEGEKYLRYPVVQKSPWPQKKQYAVALTHNVDKLVKWNVVKLCKSIAYSIQTFWRIRYHWHNFWGLLRYLFDNWEPYWNFDLISEMELDSGMQSTFFFGVISPTRYDIDYKISEEDLIQQKDELLQYGHKLALLSYYDSQKEDDYKERVEQLSDFYGKPVLGVRQNYYKEQEGQNSIFYINGKLKWDSSFCMPDRTGFINGCGYPFYLTDLNWKSHTVVEFPVNFNDSSLSGDKDNFNLEGSQNKLEDLIDNARRFRALLVFNFSLSNFEEIGWLPKTYKWLMQRLKGDPSAWKASLDDIYHWYHEREGVQIFNSRNQIEIKIAHNLKHITLYIRGLWRVTDIIERKIIEKDQEEIDLFTENTWWKLDCGEIMVTGRMIELKNIKAQSTIRLLTEKLG
jgi:hypothetical protein